MPLAYNISERLRLPILQGVLPINSAQIPAEIIAGMTLAALAVPEVMGYTKTSGTPAVTGLYTILIPVGLPTMTFGFIVIRDNNSSVFILTPLFSDFLFFDYSFLY
jgi:hypothetical protein